MAILDYESQSICRNDLGGEGNQSLNGHDSRLNGWVRRGVVRAFKETSELCFESQRPHDAPTSPGFKYGESSSKDDCGYTKLSKGFWYGQVLGIQNVVRNNTSQQGENTPYEPEDSPLGIYITL